MRSLDMNGKEFSQHLFSALRAFGLNLRQCRTDSALMILKVVFALECFFAQFANHRLSVMNIFDVAVQMILRAKDLVAAIAVIDVLFLDFHDLSVYVI
jgi:hypothetical protein